MIRKLEFRDLPRLAEMVTGLAAHHEDEMQVSVEDLALNCLGEDAWFVTLVGEGETGLWGYASLFRTGQLQFGVRGVELHHLYIEKELRGQGLGAELVGAAMEQGARMGARYMSVGTDEKNTGAHSFYEQIGFARRPPIGPRFSIRLDERALS